MKNKLEKKVTKPVATKNKEVKEIEIETVSEPRLVSYKMTATIRTGEYQNVVPEIMVEGGTMEEARTILMNEVDLIKAKYDPSVRRVVNSPAPVKAVTPAPVAPVTAPVKPIAPVTAPEAPVNTTEKSAPFLAAEKVILASKSVDALNLTEKQVEASTKLTDGEKETLLLMIIEIRKQMYAENNPA
jgi:hypothetical protein